MPTVNVPVDALAPGDWVQTGKGRIGEIANHGWDMEGSFGYVVRIDRDSDLVWVYHQTAMYAGPRRMP